MLYDITIVQFSKMLQNLNNILDKGAKYAELKKFDVEILLNSRLAPDQFNLIKQVQMICDTAKYCAARVTGKESPINDDKEKTLPELKARVEQVIQYLATYSPSDFKDIAERQITQPRWEGKYLFPLEYVIQHAIPNVYFHITTAYSILRHNGVDVGKKDYLGAMPFKF